MFPWEQESKLCHSAGLSKPPSCAHFIFLQSPYEKMWGLGSSPVSTSTKAFQRYWREETEQTATDTARFQAEIFFISKWAFIHLQNPQCCLHEALYTPHNEVLSSTACMISLPPASTTKPVSPAQLPCQAAPGESWCRATSLCHLTLLRNAPEVEVYYLSQENTHRVFFLSIAW